MPIRPMLHHAVVAGIVLLGAMPFIVTPSTIFPFVIGKSLFARTIIELVVVLWVVLAIFDPSIRPRRSRVVLIFATYVVVSGVTALGGVNVTHSVWSDYQRMGGVWDLAHWFGLVLVVASLPRSDWTLIGGGYLLSAVGLAVLTLVQGYAGLTSDVLSVDGARMAATTGHPLYVAIYLMVAVLVGAAVWAATPSPARAPDRLSEARAWTVFGWRILAGSVVGLGTWAIFLTGSRAPLLGVVAGGLAAGGIAWYPMRNRRAAATFGGVVGLALLLFAADAAFGLLHVPGQSQQGVAARTVEASSQQQSVGVRFELWGVALRAAAERPVGGWGPENFRFAFDRLAHASVYRFGPWNWDYAHSKPLEELATKGVVGFVVFLVLWVVLVREALRTRAEGARVVGLGIFGGLIAYFVQGLFLFDAPVILLPWALVVGWVAAEERGGRDGGDDDRKSGKQARGLPGGWMVFASVVFVVVSFGVVTHARMFAAARAARDALRPDVDMTARIEAADRAFADFPPMAPLLRRTVFTTFTAEWAQHDIPTRRRIIEFVTREGEPSMEANIGDARLLAAALPVLQAIATDAATLDRLDRYVTRLHEIAPNRLATHQILAAQQLEKGAYEEALRIADAFAQRAPPSGYIDIGFRVIRQVAGDALASPR